MSDINKLYNIYLEIGCNSKDLWSKELFEKFLKGRGSIFIVTKTDQNGFLIARQIKDEIELLSLYIKKKYRRKGLASNLLDQLIKIAKKNKVIRILLEVSIENYRAIYFYEKFGFMKISIRKNYYKLSNRSVDAKIMSLNL